MRLNYNEIDAFIGILNWANDRNSNKEPCEIHFIGNSVSKITNSKDFKTGLKTINLSQIIFTSQNGRIITINDYDPTRDDKIFELKVYGKNCYPLKHDIRRIFDNSMDLINELKILSDNLL